jgi:ketosteroid isomerase-like protein
MASTYEVGKKLVELCNAGKFMEAAKELYADNIASIEAMSGPQMPARLDSKAAVLKKAEWWEANHEVHSVKVEGPWPHGDRFVVRFTMDVTPKAGPMAGKRMHMEEAALYTVKDGKVVQEEFFYHMG